ncbi:hypothetical protein ACNFCI_08305 [Pseudomonas sp. NY15356]|uniref:hypothetical protein n=1 Tax=unclassified Pseudomonas TaxID=196821 RepID=UPI003A8B2939
MGAAKAMAVYGIEEVSAKLAYEIGLLFFRVIKLEVTASGYYRYREDRADEDIDFIEVSRAKLKGKIEAGRATSFRLYCTSESSNLWDASFGYTTNDFGGFYHFDAQCLDQHFGKDKFLEFVEKLGELSEFRYAIFYSVDDVSEGFYYAGGENLSSVYDYENPILFNKETGGRFKGAERYKDKMLRMVYPLNVINEEHLNLQVGDGKLQDWILSEERRGLLKPSLNRMWVWEVKEENLEYVNAELGAAGLLIAWKPLRSAKKSKLTF